MAEIQIPQTLVSIIDTCDEIRLAGLALTE
jgi:hypothetical protein